MLKHFENGFYQVGDTWTSKNKYRAVLHAVENNLPLHWNFNDELYDTVPWEIEPIESLKELYKQRALEIRDAYEYVAIAYSGGVDSHNVLMAFIDNNIPFNEVISFQHLPEGSYTASTTKDLRNISSERDYVIRPTLKMIAEKYPSVKISTDYSWVQEFVNDFDSGKLKKLNPGEHLDIGVVMSANYRFGVDKNKLFRDVYNKSGATIVFGVDKPRILYNKNVNSYVFEFTDTNVHLSSASSFEEGYSSTFFYWGDTVIATQLMRKQCHTILSSVSTVHSDGRVVYDDNLIYPHSVAFSVGKGALGSKFSSQNAVLTTLNDLKYFNYVQYLTLAEKEASKSLFGQYNNQWQNDIKLPGALKRVNSKQRVLKRLD